MPEREDEAEELKRPEINQVPGASDAVEKGTIIVDGSSSKYDGTEHELGSTEKVMPDDEPPKRQNWFKRCWGGYWHHKKWTLPLTVVVLLATVFALPVTRYPILALGMKRQFTVVVMDSKTNTPVSGAEVRLDGKTTTTDSSGKASLDSKVGKRTLEISKQYYKSFSEGVFVGIATGNNSSAVSLNATGRQVPVKVVNKITGKIVAGAEIKVLDTEAKTDSKGTATIVLPTTSVTQSAAITANGYNNITAKVQVTSKVVSANTFQITPSGRIYFLSNLKGNIDVVGANLDGTGRKTILAGTGNEDANNTVLLASRDWKYLALLSKRDGGNYPKLFLINTRDDSVTTMDEGTANFTLIGWSGHDFVYEVNRSDVNAWQSGQVILKSYNADSGKIAQIDQSTATGSQGNYVTQGFAFVNLLGSRVVYGVDWGGNTTQTLSGKHNSIMSADADGSNKKDIKDITIPSGSSYTYMSAVQTKPEALEIQSSVNGQSNVYYTYRYQNNSVTQTNTVTDNSFNQDRQNHVTYLISPSGGNTFWDEPRDGKNTLFVGDYHGDNGKQIAALSDYSPYGWFSDKYLLVQKSGSELYIMPVGGGKALKVSDYYKPPHTYYGYGGGYGGL